VIPTLFITRDGLLEPLGQSQVLAYLKGLSTRYRITVISFEKPEDIANDALVVTVAEVCREHGIRWLPQRFHPRPRLLAAAWDLATMTWLCLREAGGGRAALVHARSYIPAAVALLINRLCGTPFIFDMRALWPEEVITAGRLRRGSLLHRLICRIERACLSRADSVISLTHAAAAYLQRIYSDLGLERKIVVIPTCADLARFVPAPSRRPVERVYGCVGTILSGWFRADWLGRFFDAVAARDRSAVFHIISRDDPAQVRAALRLSEEAESRLTIYGMPSDQVHHAVQGLHASAMFFTDGLSKLGSSPTRTGEMLGCGIPIVANPGVGDVGAIIAENRVGILVDGPGAADMDRAAADIEAVMDDPDLIDRCRATADRLFSLEAATDAYAGIYGRIAAQASGRRR